MVPVQSELKASSAGRGLHGTPVTHALTLPSVLAHVCEHDVALPRQMTCPYVTSDGCGLLFHAYGHGSEAVSAGESVVKCAFVPGTTPACTTLFALNGATQEFAALGDGKPLYESPWYAKYSVQWNHK